MCIRCRRQSICRQTGNEPRAGEAGAVTVVMLCLMLVVVLFALAMLHTIHTMQAADEEYQQETQLRLAAEGVTEQAAQLLTAHPEQAEVGWGHKRTEIKTAGFCYPDNMAVQVTAVPRQDKLYLLGFARYKEAGARWERHRLVKGVLRKEGTSYVWLGWAP